MKRWFQNWPVHNLIAHPLMQILVWLGMPRLADRIHDGTLPPDADD